MKVDAEKDFHGYTAAGMLSWLDQQWSSRRWDGLQRVRIIHGKGEVLIPALRHWSEERGISWAPEPGNPGATILHPSRRTSNKPARVDQSISKPAIPQHRPRTSHDHASKRKPPNPDDAELFEAEIRRLAKSMKRK